MVWVSDDGLAWNHITYYLDGQQVSGAITTFGDEIVAVGLDADKTTDIIWYSTDGEDWGILTPPAFGNAGGIPMVAYTHNNQIIILGSGGRADNRPPITGILGGSQRVAYVACWFVEWHSHRVEHGSLHRFGIDDPLMAN